ncbi:hypothetical protein [Massilia pseudoviolaceinigra]|uniref:hypothetical protein n=1 Tax=Massilia pseudoviolaceinigra TaxID=3057165 RepID=UPI002796776A|nr:hypothetical protein [Massilia sp. CCM 9206]MDQ1921687.1 hypothetical protein [Massilia sp. CCM 9206]
MIAHDQMAAPAPVQQAAPSGIDDGVRFRFIEQIEPGRWEITEESEGEGKQRQAFMQWRWTLESGYGVTEWDDDIRSLIDGHIRTLSPEDQALLQRPPAPAQPAGLSDLDAIKQAASVHGYVLAWAGHTTLNDCAKYGWHAGEVQKIFHAAVQSEKIAPTSGKSPLAAGLSEQDKLDAERYRLLRDSDEGIEFRDGNCQWRADRPTGDELDSIIDAAILAAKEAP